MSKSMMRMLLLGALTAGALSSQALAAPDLTGDWILQSDPTAVPAARTTPAAAAKAKTLSARAQWMDAPNGSPEYANVWCIAQGMPWQQTNTLPLTIAQGVLETAIISPVRSDRRHIYTDGQPHPDPDTFEPTTVGHSIGRWQGDTLVVDTTRFSDKGVLLIPGGAVRTVTSRLAERYKLTDADTLSVTSTWTDPKTLRAPHTYTYVYKRLKDPAWFRPVSCNALRAAFAKGLPLPPGTQRP